MSFIGAYVEEKEGNEKRRKVLSTSKEIYSIKNIDVSKNKEFDNSNVSEYELEDDEWFKIPISNIGESAISICESVAKITQGSSLKKLERKELNEVRFVFSLVNGFVVMQNVKKSKYEASKTIMTFGVAFKLQENAVAITINEIPDVIYDKENKMLYFKDVKKVDEIFNTHIVTSAEIADDSTVEEFLKSDFICANNGFGFNKVKVANRKRIVKANGILQKLNASDIEKMLKYIDDNCGLSKEGNQYIVSNERELKKLLYGIEERFYKTNVTGEERAANRYIPAKEV